MKRILTLAFAAASLVCAAASAAATKLVVCAPGYPGSTVEAQPSLDAFADAAIEAAGWSEGSLISVYYPTEDAGLTALADKSAALALVAWPFYEKHGKELQLVEIAEAVYKTTGRDEAWSLVAKKGRVASADQLKGWEIQSLAGYAPEFVRGALASWGKIPADVRITATSQVLSALRRAASANDVAVLMDGAQSASLASLPFAAELEVVATSPRVPVAVVCTVGGRLPPQRAAAFAQALERLNDGPKGLAALEGIRLTGFVPVTVTRSKAASPRK